MMIVVDLMIDIVGLGMDPRILSMMLKLVSLKA
jgi:hypothetical protein